MLDGLLRDLQQLDVPCDIALLLAEVQSLSSLEEKECQALNTLIAHVDGIYELKVITEQFTAMLREENDESGKNAACMSHTNPIYGLASHELTNRFHITVHLFSNRITDDVKMW